MPNCGFRQGTHRNRRVTHSANKRSGERETGCALGMCVHGLRFGSLALRLSREIPVKSLFWQKKNDVLDKLSGSLQRCFSGPSQTLRTCRLGS